MRDAPITMRRLIRQYLPKKQSMAHLTQHDCNRIAKQLNTRPRKRLGYRTPGGTLGAMTLIVALQS